ncbi:MAG TPA: septum formation initiator family protein [Acidimicrobiia bacterium]|jgi:cell division protein FtsB|nr:septum formation initiator family protein [Acidimicrobiia bacterium]
MTRGARARLALAALALVAILFVFVFPTRSYLAQRRQVSAAQHDVDLLKQQNDKLQAQATRLQTPAEIERMAREQFHRVFPGEQVYDVVPSGSTPPGTSSTTLP